MVAAYFDLGPRSSPGAGKMTSPPQSDGTALVQMFAQSGGGGLRVKTAPPKERGDG